MRAAPALAGKVLALSIVFGGAAVAAGPDPGLNVTVTNPTSQPVPVSIQGTGTISGAVTITNSPTVQIDDTVSTVATDRTVAVFSGFPSAKDTIFANNPVVGPFDVSAYKTVRVQLQRSSCSGCGAMQVEVLSGSFNIDLIDLPARGGSFETAPFATRVYDVPGTELQLRLRNMVAGQDNSVVLRVFGRSN